MKGKMPDFEAYAVEETKNAEKKNRWTRIGVAFVNKDSVSIRLNALPLNGEIVLLKPKPKETKPPEKMKVF